MKIFGLDLIATTLALVGANALAVRTTKERPIARVVKMLEDMKSQLEKDAADDAAVYDELVCWCKTNREEKAAAIALAKQTIANLEAEMGEDAAKIDELQETVKNQRVENRNNQKALDDATALRMKEVKEFHSTEKDMLATIAACGDAVAVLSKHNPELAQLKAVAKSLLATKVVAEAGSHSTSTFDGVMALKGFLNNINSNPSFLQQPAGYNSYNNQSGQIFGILKQMKETFEENLSEAQKEEEAKKAAYKELKAAKKAELAAGKKALANAQETLAATREKYAEAEEARANTMEQQKIDEEFLANLEKKCAQTDADYAARTKSRNEEIAAVADTISILNSDDAFDQMDKTVNSETTSTNFDGTSLATFFVQTSAQNQQKLVSILESAAKKNPKIALIATYAKLAAFEKVKKAISDMIAELKVQMKDEVDHRDYCVEQFGKNRLETEAEEDTLNGLVAKIADLETTIKSLKGELESLNKEIAEMTNQAQRATSDRGRGNADFQVELKDQRITQGILQKALERMQAKYAFLQGAPHIQTSGTKTDPGNGPARFNEYGLNNGGAKVVALLTEVINDSKKQEKELLLSEGDAQAAYETFMTDTSKSIDIKQKAIVAKTEEKAVAEQDLSASQTAKAASLKQLEALNDYKGQLHSSCDFLLKNFDSRQQARSEEMEALRQATAILSGAK